MRPYKHDELTSKQVAEIIGLSHTHVRDTIMKSPDFPEPIIALSRKTKRWARSDVMDFIKKRSIKNLSRRR